MSNFVRGHNVFVLTAVGQKTNVNDGTLAVTAKDGEGNTHVLRVLPGLKSPFEQLAKDDVSF